jgi:hypothetical protein
MSTFSESQRFRQWWMWTILFIAFLVPLGFGCYNWYLHGFEKQWLYGLSVTVIGPILILVLLRVIKLETKIDHTGVYYCFAPFQRKLSLKPWDEVAKAYVREYKPIREFGGWGIRISLRNGAAYNISGNMGLQLVMKNGKKLLIGTQQPNEINELLLTLVQTKVLTHDMMRP